MRIRGSATATTFVSGFDYDARGQRQRCVHGNGTVTTYAYDPRTFRLVRLRLVREADAAVLQDLRYTYDPVGNITEIRDGAQQAVYFANAVVSADQRFEYDALYRLVRAEGREHASLGQPTDADFNFGPQPHPDDPAALRRYEQEYAWDEVGNLAQLRHVAGSGSFTRRYVYAAASNRLLANAAPGEAALPFSHSYTYDEHGNMTSMPHLAAIAWDHADRMQHCDLGGGGDVWFVYDAAGERVRKVQVNASGSTVRERVYLGGYEVYRERAANSAVPEVERQTLHVGDDRGKLALVETLTVDDGDPVGAPSSIHRHQHGNHLGSASLELDGNAAVISYEEFHPFGTTSYAANDAGIEVSAKRYRYIGTERDEETGLYHLGARYYASWLGRWTAADPIGLGDGVNRYAYVRGNPLRLLDPGGTAGQPNIFERIGREVATNVARAATDGAKAVVTAARRAKREDQILTAVKGEAVRQYEGALKTADAESIAYQKAFAEENGFFLGRITSQFEPGGDGPRKVSEFQTSLAFALKGSASASLSEKAAIVQNVLDHAVQGIDWRGDVAETVAAIGDRGAGLGGRPLRSLSARGNASISDGAGGGGGGGKPSGAGTPRERVANVPASEGGDRFTVDPTMEAADAAAGVLVNGRYIKNPSAQNLGDMVTATGKIGSSKKSGQFMYVVDDAGNIIIGTRAGQRMPHPTLVGGPNPTVQAAGIVDIRGGRIFSVNNSSGHFKPGPGSLEAAERAFGNLPAGAFHRNFQGYLPFQ